jgi:hypothetical protein
MPTFLYVLVGIFIFLFLLSLFFRLNHYIQGDQVILLSKPLSGKNHITLPDPSIPRSFNQPEGITFTYAGWVLVNDFTFNYGKSRRIISKGDCPGVYLDTTSNGLMVAINTYGAKETILISNIPAKKWVHFAVIVNQYSVDIYINGTIRQHHTLGQLPKQDNENVEIGSDEGFDGTINLVSYWPRSLNQEDLDKLVKAMPTDLYTPPSYPQYFDITWYTGRL